MPGYDPNRTFNHRGRLAAICALRSRALGWFGTGKRVATRDYNVDITLRWDEMRLDRL
jgi:hypothetical protein